MLINRVRKDEHETNNKVIRSNLLSDETKFNIHVHRNVDMLQSKIR